MKKNKKPLQNFIIASYILTWIWFVCVIILFIFGTEIMRIIEYVALFTCLLVTFFCGRLILQFYKLYIEDETTKETPNN